MEATALEMCTKNNLAVDGKYTFIGMGVTKSGERAKTLQETILKEKTDKSNCGILPKQIESFQRTKN